MSTTEIFTEPKMLNRVIDKLIEQLSKDKTGTEEYTTLVAQLTQLYKMKEIDIKLALLEMETEGKQKAQQADCDLKDLEIETKKKEMKIPFGIKPETLALVAANLVGIAMIIGHERINVIATKALGFVMKSK